MPDREKYQESSIGFENLAYLQSIENKCNPSMTVKYLNQVMNIEKALL